VALDKLFQKGVFRVLAPSNQSFMESLLQVMGLQIADSEVLALAKEHNGIDILDD